MSVCTTCRDPLFLEIHDITDDEDVSMGASSKGGAVTKVPDDVHLKCGCHFHWDCLLESYSIDSCPSCSSSLLTPAPNGGQQILCTLTNEGGVQEDLDILPLLTEESYLKAYPEEIKARAFLEFCRAGDLQAIVEMLQDAEDSDDEDEDMADDGDGHEVDFLRYQDPIGDMQSGLHAAVQNGSQEVAWLLLLVASKLEMQQFPAQVFQEAEKLAIARPDDSETAGKADIRSLRDSQGRSAEDVAREVGGWEEWIGTGRLVI